MSFMKQCEICTYIKRDGIGNSIYLQGLSSFSVSISDISTARLSLLSIFFLLFLLPILHFPTFSTSSLLILLPCQVTTTATATAIVFLYQGLNLGLHVLYNVRGEFSNTEIFQQLHFTFVLRQNLKNFLKLSLFQPHDSD